MAQGGRRGRRGEQRFDQALKLLGERWAPQLAALLFPGTQLEEPLASDLPVSERRADWLWRARLDGEPCVLHVEFQLRGKPDMVQRMFDYGSRIQSQYRLPPLGVLVYLVETRPLAQSPFLSRLRARNIMQYDFTVVRLWEVDPAPIVQGELAGLLPLVPLMRDADPTQVPELAEHVMEVPGLDALQRGDLIGMLATFSALRFPRTDIWDLIRRNTMLSELMDELIEDSPFLRQIRDEAASQARQEGLAVGRQEGLAVGRQEGLVEEARALVREIVTARAFDLQNELQALDRLSSLAQLHALARALVAAPDVEAAREALRRALDEGGPSTPEEPT